MGNSGTDSEGVKVREQGVIKVSYTTGLILAGIIFLASLLSGWINQAKDISQVLADQRDMQGKITVNSNRLTILEQFIITNKQDMVDVKSDLKDVNKTMMSLAILLETHDQTSKKMLKQKVEER